MQLIKTYSHYFRPARWMNLNLWPSCLCSYLKTIPTVLYCFPLSLQEVSCLPFGHLWNFSSAHLILSFITVTCWFILALARELNILESSELLNECLLIWICRMVEVSVFWSWGLVSFFFHCLFIFYLLIRLCSDFPLSSHLRLIGRFGFCSSLVSHVHVWYWYYFNTFHTVRVGIHNQWRLLSLQSWTTLRMSSIILERKWTSLTGQVFSIIQSEVNIPCFYFVCNKIQTLISWGLCNQ